jgi:hypothetical protein
LPRSGNKASNRKPINNHAAGLKPMGPHTVGHAEAGDY